MLTAMPWLVVLVWLPQLSDLDSFPNSEVLRAVEQQIRVLESVARSRYAFDPRHLEEQVEADRLLELARLYAAVASAQSVREAQLDSAEGDPEGVVDLPWLWENLTTLYLLLGRDAYYRGSLPLP